MKLKPSIKVTFHEVHKLVKNNKSIADISDYFKTSLLAVEHFLYKHHLSLELLKNQDEDAIAQLIGPKNYYEKQINLSISIKQYSLKMIHEACLQELHDPSVVLGVSKPTINLHLHLFKFNDVPLTITALKNKTKEELESYFEIEYILPFTEIKRDKPIIYNPKKIDCYSYELRLSHLPLYTLPNSYIFSCIKQSASLYGVAELLNTSIDVVKMIIDLYGTIDPSMKFTILKLMNEQQAKDFFGDKYNKSIKDIVDEKILKFVSLEALRQSAVVPVASYEQYPQTTDNNPQGSTEFLTPDELNAVKDFLNEPDPVPLTETTTTTQTDNQDDDMKSILLNMLANYESNYVNSGFFNATKRSREEDPDLNPVKKPFIN